VNFWMISMDWRMPLSCHGGGVGHSGLID